jgi:hypothetical protein
MQVEMASGRKSEWRSSRRADDHLSPVRADVPLMLSAVDPGENVITASFRIESSFLSAQDGGLHRFPPSFQGAQPVEILSDSVVARPVHPRIDAFPLSAALRGFRPAEDDRSTSG